MIIMLEIVTDNTRQIIDKFLLFADLMNANSKYVTMYSWAQSSFNRRMQWQGLSL